MSSLFSSVIRQAFKTFDRSNQSTFNINFPMLKQFTDQLTYHDVHLSQQDLLNDAVFAHAGRAPCIYLHIFENCDIAMSVFVMRAGYTMPLHDHPMMYGVLRGIYGKLRVQSYTRKYALSTSNKSVDSCNLRGIPVVADDPHYIGMDTESAVLTPDKSNFHEITAVGGVAAFFDILSPPYDVFIPEYGVRRCTFYRPVSDVSCKDEVNSVRLEHVPDPSSYYCDTALVAPVIQQCVIMCAEELIN